MSAEPVNLQRKEGLAILTLSNPDANRLNRAVLDGLGAALAQIRQSEVRAVLLRAEGPVFSWGADVKELFVESQRADLLRLLSAYLEFIAALEALPKPTIAAVHGVCSSGGLELALGCDYLWAAAGTKIGFLEASLGIPPLAGGVQRIAARVGSARALEIAAAGQMYDAETFERWNIVNRVLPADTLQHDAEAFAARLAAGPTRAYAAIKTLLRSYERSGVAATDAITVATVAPLMDSADAGAAIAALMAQGPGRARIAFSGT